MKASMSLVDRVAALFVKCFKLELEEFSRDLVPEDVLLWDSLGHMNLVMELEDEFGLHLEVDEITEMSSAGKIIDILKAKGVADEG
jgi:acyl carrier protein